MFRPLLAIAITASTLLTQTGTDRVHAQAPRGSLSTPTPTLFGPGPELYVSPTWGTVGRRVTVVGLGYRPGQSVVISASSYDPYAGGPTSYWEQTVRAQTVVRADGRLRVSFVIPASYARLVQQQTMAPLDIRTHYGRGPAAGATRAVGSHAIFMLMTPTFAPGPAWGS